MPNHLDEETERIHINLYKRDVERINAIRGRTPFNKAVRNMIRLTLNQIEAKASQSAKPVKLREEIEL